MLPLITYSFYVYLDFFKNDIISNFKIIIVGICFSLVFFTKMNMTGLWLILSLVVIIKSIIEKKIKNLYIFILNFLIGIAIVLIPIIIYFILNNSLYDMIYQSFILNIAYSGDSPIDKYQIISWVVSIFNSYLLTIIVGITSIIYYKKNKMFVICGLLLLSFCILMSIISKREYLHYLIVLIPLFIPYIVLFIDELLNIINNKLGIVLLIISILVAYFPHINNIKEQTHVRNQDNAIYIREATEYIKLNTKESDRIYGHRLYGSVYLLADRLSSTKYFFIPGFYDDKIIKDDFKDSFSKNLPIYIVISEDRIFDMAIDNYILEIVNNKYELVMTNNKTRTYILKNDFN